MLHRLIYVSRPFGFDSATLGGIMVGARRNNLRDGLTGALICRADIYLQLLEGPLPSVLAAFTRIAADDRHCDLEQLTAGAITARLFPAWAMLDDPARSWLWSAAEVANGAVTCASPDAIIDVFVRLAAERKLRDVGANDGMQRSPESVACPLGTMA